MRFNSLFLVLLVAGVVSAASFDAPKRKSGLWEISISNPQAGGGHTIQQCVDQKTDDLMKKEMGDSQKTQCSKNEMRKEGNKIIAESVCKMQNSTATTRAVFTGAFDSAYKGDIKTVYEPPFMGMKESSSVVEARWLGACKAGQKPGDIVMPGMPNINMDEMMKRGMKRP